MIFDRRSFLIGSGALALSACASGKGGRTKLVLGDQVHLQQARMEAAGQLKNLSYDVSWANFPGAAPLLEAMNAGAIDTGIAGDLPVVLAAAAGVPVRLIAAARSSTKNIGIIVPPGSPIKSVADLRGKRVIVSTARGSISHYLLIEALHEAKVDPRGVSIGFMLPTEAGAAFAAGQIEAWATFGIYQITAETRGARVIRSGEGINTGYGLILASEAALTDPGKRGAISDYLPRLKRAQDWSRANADAYTKIYAKQTGVPLDLARLVVERENPDLVPLGPEIVAALQRVADRFHGYGEIPKKVDIARLVDAGLWQG